MSEPLMEKPNAEANPTASTAGIVMDNRYLPPPQDGDGKIWVRTSALIQRSPEELYELWHDVESAPKWQEQIAQVTRTGEMTSHWVMRSGDSSIEWNSMILADEPGRRITWRSISGESNNAGEVVFEPAPGGRGTIVIVLQEFRLGKMAALWETMVGRHPKQAVIENLRHFKALAESGEIPRTQGQPHGDRGFVGGLKQSVYGEKIATPPGDNRIAS